MLAKYIAAISANRRLWIVLLVFAAIPVLAALPSAAQSPDFAGQERTLRMKEGFSVPLEVKLRNLQSETWLKDLEIEVKNVGKKPIYSIVAYLMFPDAKLAGNVGIPLDYGNPKNVSFDRYAEAEDPHIGPGDSYVFKIDSNLQKGFEEWLKEAVDPPEAYKKITLWVEIISFGDGTGLVNGGLRRSGKIPPK